MMGVWLFVVIIFCLIFGWAGVAIASNKGVSGGAGFWLGFFLGPIGLVIVALLSPPAEAQPSEPPVPRQFEGERDLKNDAYKLWLTSRYGIKRNDVLGSYVCEERLFPTVDEALHYASEQHLAEVAAAEAEQRRKAEERDRQREAAQQAYEEADANWKRRRPYVIFVGTLMFIGFCYLMYLAVQDQAKRTRMEQQQAAKAKRKHDALLAPVNATLASYGVALVGDNANEPGTDTDQDACIFTTGDGQSKKIVGKGAHFVTVTYPPDKTVGDVRLTPAGEWVSKSLDKGLGLDEAWLFANKRTGKFILITAHDETNYQASASDLTFRTKVHLCVGKSVDW
jgi:hypothetical protein